MRPDYFSRLLKSRSRGVILSEAKDLLFQESMSSIRLTQD
jgi:hypothetical protein